MIQTLIISTNTQCNLDCIYCHNRTYFKSNYDSDKILEFSSFQRICTTYFDYVIKNNQKVADFCFSGGEPLLLGIDFFKNIHEVQQSIKRFYPDTFEISNEIQTNGTLLNESWIKFIKAYNFKIGISIDGSKCIQDRTRPFKTQTGSFDAIERSLSLLFDAHIPFGLLFVVSQINKYDAESIVDFAISKHPSSIAFIPCLDYGAPIDATSYGKFLIKAFDRWIENGAFNIKIRNFWFAMLLMLGGDNVKIPCENAGSCPCTININLNGDIFICDAFMGTDAGYLGNIHDIDLANIYTGKFYQKIENTILPLHDDCKICKFLFLCKGGCLYRRLNKDNMDFLCSSNLDLFQHIYEFMHRDLLIGLK